MKGLRLQDLPNHHAVLVVGDRKQRTDELIASFPSLTVYRLYDQTVLDIDTAREIISFAQAAYNDEKIILISFVFVTLPAQNAMLKILEDPRIGVRFILVTSNKELLLPTVLSRVQVVMLDGKSNDDSALKFLETKPLSRMRLKEVEILLSQEDEEGRKDREAVLRFVLNLVDVLHEKKAPPQTIKETLRMASYASDPSSSGKAILEYLGLLLPVCK